ncbi:MAG TPA: ornithine cyclodeaminase family protein [Thermodesulfobacteriota bacterium]|nr:ornithine cyclodeaminase family protein [Thermodesulfobacteriota bacterium]
MVLYLGEDDVRQILTMSDAIKALEETFRQQGLGNVINNPRQRVRTDVSMLHYLAGALPHLGVMGYKAYTSSRAGIKFRVFLHDIETGELLSIMDGNYMGMMRTGAVSGVATKYMAREDMSRVGLYGSGWQARGQLLAAAAVRNVKKVNVYSRDQAAREAFSRDMEKQMRVTVTPVATAEEAARDADCVITATTSFEPVFRGEWLAKGAHVNAVGGNFLFKREIDERTVRSAEVIVVESIEQSKIEAGEFMPLIEKGTLRWSQVAELGDVVAGRTSGRRSGEDITLFKSLGIAVEDLAVAARVYKTAKEAGIGKKLDMPSN